MKLLLGVAERVDLSGRIAAMFSGERINVTEGRAVLHTALRAPADAVIVEEGENVVPSVHAVLDKAAEFAEQVRSGRWTGHTGERSSNTGQRMTTGRVENYTAERNDQYVPGIGRGVADDAHCDDHRC